MVLVGNNMRFVVIYKNSPEIRNHVLNVLTQVLSQNVNLEQTPVNHPLCQIRPSWPDMQSLLNLPLNMQCEQIEYAEGKFNTVRQNVIDIEVIVTKTVEVEKTVDKSPSSS